MTERERRENECISNQCTSPKESHTLITLGFVERSYFQHALVSNAPPPPGEHLILPAWTLTELIPHVELTDEQCITVMRADRPPDTLAAILIERLTPVQNVSHVDAEEKTEEVSEESS